MRQKKLQKKSAKPNKTTTQAERSTVNSADGTTTATEDVNVKECVIVVLKNDDNPPSYEEEEALVPTYDEAIGLALNAKK